jgi:hypothetical protein
MCVWEVPGLVEGNVNRGAGVVAIEQQLPLLRHARPEPLLSVYKREVPEVFSIEPEKVEDVESGAPHV